MRTDKIKKFLQIIITGFCTLLIFVLFLIILASSRPAEKLINSFIIKKLESSLGYSVSSCDLETNIVSRLQVKEVILLYPDSSIFLKLGYGRADYILPEILINGFSLRSLYLESLNLNIKKDSIKKTLLPGSSLQDQKNNDRDTTSLHLFVKNINIQNSFISFQDQTIPLKGRFRGIDFNGHLKKNMNYLFQFSSDSGSVVHQKKKIYLDQTSIQGIIGNDYWEINNLNSKCAGLLLTGNLKGKQSIPTQGTFTLKGPINFLSDIFCSTIDSVLIPVSGTLYAQVQIESEILKPKYKTCVTIKNLKLGKLPDFNTSFQGTYKNSLISLKELKITTAESQISGQGTVKIDSLLNHHLTLSYKNLFLSDLLKILPQKFKGITGIINGSIVSSGPIRSLKNLNIISNIELTEIQHQNKIIPDLTTKLSLHSGFASLILDQEENRLRSQWQITEDEIRGEYSLHLPHLESSAELLKISGLKGSVTTEGRITNLLHDPFIISEIQGKAIKYHTFLLDSLAASIIYRNKELSLKNSLILCKNKLICEARAQYELHSSKGNLDITFTEKNSDKKIYDSIPSDHRIVYTADSVLVGTISGKFQKDKNQTWQLKTEGKKLQLDKIFSMYKKKHDLKGTLGFQLSLSSDNYNPSAILNFQVDSLGIERTLIDSLQGTIELKNNQLALIPLRIYSGGNESRTEAFCELTKSQTGKYTLTPESNIWGQTKGREIDLQFIPPLFGLNTQVSGISNFELQWKGTWKKPSLKGFLHIQNGTMKIHSDAEKIHSLEANISLADSLVLVNRISGKINDIPFLIQGQIANSAKSKFQTNMHLSTDGREVLTLNGLRTTDSLKVQAKINNMPFSLFKNIAPGIEQMEGQLKGQIYALGSSENPNLRGDLKAINIKFQPDFLNVPLTNGIIHISFNNNKIILDSLLFTINKGNIRATGMSTISGKNLIDLKTEFNVNQVTLKYPQKFKLNIQSIQINLKKSQNNFIIAGDVILGRSTLLWDIGPKNLISFFNKVEKPHPSPSGFFQKTQLNLKIRGSNNLLVNNNIARLRLHPELTFIGTLANPNITGRITAEEGYILYFDRKFNIQKGILDFIDPYQINPLVDIQAQADLKNYQTLSNQTYQITLNIQGPLEKAALNLTSNPPLEKSDIITVLTVGATRKELMGKDETGKPSITNVLEDRLGLISSSQVSGFASRQIGDLIGLKEMSVEGNLFKFGKSWGPRLVASKTITDRMEISYSTRVGHSNEQSIRLDYRLLKNLSLQGLTDQQGQSGIDLKFHWKFK